MDGFASLGGFLRTHAEQQPSASAFVFVGRGSEEPVTLTWGELYSRACFVAGKITGQGTEHARLLLLCEAEVFVCALAGCLLSGAVAVPAPLPFNPRTAPRIRAICDNVRPDAILASSHLAGQPWLRNLAGAAGAEIIVLDDGDGWRDGATDASFDGHGVGSDDLALIQYSSGTTGDPKGVCLSHGNLFANCRTAVDAFELSPRSIGVSWLPLHHDMGLVGHVLSPFMVGCTSVLLDSLSFLQRPIRWLQAISKYRATATCAPNFAYEMCCRAMAAAGGDPEMNLATLEMALCGGEPVSAATMERFCQVFSRFGFRKEALSPSYGLAEATVLVSTSYGTGGPQSLQVDGKRVVSCGKPRGCTVSIRDPEGVALPEGITGEICIAGPSVGRVGLDSMRGAPPTYLGTGDLGFMMGGDLYVSGRIKDLVIVNGQNVHPEDAEQAVLPLSDCIVPGGVAAVGVSEAGTEKLCVAVELSRSPDQTSDLRGRINVAVAAATGIVPARVVFLAAGKLPRTTSGKVRRREVAAVIDAIDAAASSKVPLA
jgi:acyl-CoA synthetase (AMP-forming)/AMP-acid ligase II